MRILFVWSGLTGYMGDCWRALSKLADVKILVDGTGLGKNFKDAVMDGLDWERVGTRDAIGRITAFAPDVIAVVGWHRELPREIAFAGGEKIVLTYLDAALLKIAEAVRKLDLSNLRNVTVEHAADVDSKDMADRIAAFFRAVTRPADSKKAKKHVSPVKVAESAALRPLTVRMGDLEISAADREALSVLVRRALNVLNVLRYPEYGPQPAMEPSDSRHFPYVRW